MHEGAEHDDKYRMVEDEFFTTAQKFTVHLHTAEYKRQEKLVKSRKADAISSISRPVTGRMPDETKRKVESINRTKTQRNALESMISKAGKPKDSDDSDDAIDLPYFGTTLHGLMDSPRRKTAYLGKMGSVKSTTRAAAGFKKSSAQLKSSQKSISESPQATRYGKVPKIEAGSSTASSDDDDDDLDAPIPAPKLNVVKKEDTTKGNSLLSSISIAPTTQSTKAMGKAAVSDSTFRVKKEATESSSRLGEFNARSAPKPGLEKPQISRVELARRHRAQLELEEQKKKRGVIPTFLG
jgi:hypothetical protein